MMAGSTVRGVVLKRIGYPVGFAVSGGVALLALFWFFGMTRRLGKG
jgi:predicted MFS family arabinose efflux permease